MCYNVNMTKSAAPAPIAGKLADAFWANCSNHLALIAAKAGQRPEKVDAKLVAAAAEKTSREVWLHVADQAGVCQTDEVIDLAIRYLRARADHKLTKAEWILIGCP